MAARAGALTPGSKRMLILLFLGLLMVAALCIPGVAGRFFSLVVAAGVAVGLLFLFLMALGWLVGAP